MVLERNHQHKLAAPFPSGFLQAVGKVWAPVARLGTISANCQGKWATSRTAEEHSVETKKRQL